MVKDKWVDRVYIIWAIAFKDILDALKNKVVLSMVFLLGLMLLAPKLITLITTQPAGMVTIYDSGKSSLATDLESSSQFQLRKASSFQELEWMLTNSINPEMGLVVPLDFDQALSSGEQLELKGYVTWANRSKAPELKADLEKQLTELLNRPVSIQIEGNIVYPSTNSGLFYGLVTLNTLTLMLLMGIILVPALLFEEKQTRTIDALLVSPASISQVVAGKALAGVFYTLVSAALVFAVYWSSVVQWGVALLFVAASGLFAVAVGLVLGSFFENQQEVSGWIGLLLIVFIGPVFILLLNVPVPAFVQALLPWTPSVALVNIYSYAFSGSTPSLKLWSNLGIVVGISALLYAVVVWKVRRMDV